VGLRAGLDRCGKSRPPPGFDPLTVQPVGSGYTDYAPSAYRPRIRGSVLAKTKRFFYSQTSVTCFGAHTASYEICIEKGGRGVKLMTRVYLRPRLRMGAALPPVAPYAYNVQRENCLFLKYPLICIFCFRTPDMLTVAAERWQDVFIWLIYWNITYILASEVTVYKRELPWYSHTVWQCILITLYMVSGSHCRSNKCIRRIWCNASNLFVSVNASLTNPFIWALSLALNPARYKKQTFLLHFEGIVSIVCRKSMKLTWNWDLAPFGLRV